MLCDLYLCSHLEGVLDENSKAPLKLETTRRRDDKMKWQNNYSIHPMALQPISGLGVLCFLPPCRSIICGPFPVTTLDHSSSISSHCSLPPSSGPSRCSYPSEFSIQSFLGDPCIFHLNMPCPMQSSYFNTCHQVRFLMRFIHFMIVSYPPLTIVIHWVKNQNSYYRIEISNSVKVENIVFG
jgi:hypothetical protein